MTDKEAAKILNEHDTVAIYGTARDFCAFTEACEMGAEALEKPTNTSGTNYAKPRMICPNI